jgi:predicted DNA-binding protein
MANNTATSKIIQVQVPNQIQEDLDLISSKTHVSKSVIIRMGIENIIRDIKEGKVQMGIKFG